MSEEDFKNERFPELCRTAAYTVWKKYLRAPQVLSDFLNDCYVYILSNKDRLTDYSLEDEKNLFYNIFKLCANVLGFYERRTEKTFTDMGDELFIRHKTSGFSVWDVVSCSALREELKEFLEKNYNKNDKECLILLIKGIKSQLISKKYKVSIRKLSEMLRNFRKDFQAYLINTGYLDGEMYSSFDETSHALQVYRRRQARKKGEAIDFNEYKHECLICKLLRDEADLTPYAQSLNMSVKDLDEIITHKSCKKLFLYQIQILRKSFPEYSFKSLAGVVC